MIHCNGNVEFEANLNEKEAKWWQDRITELGEESEIISRDPEPVKSVEECIRYLEVKGKGIVREAILGCELAESVMEAYKLSYDVQSDSFAHVFLEIAVNSYIYSKKFTLSMKDSDIYEDRDMWDNIQDLSNKDYLRSYINK